ncbi:ornithine decarboxylase [Spathaspora passalidarum NRRL Y-27907]|uniref:Ornithine decarboxylase n=1 Tax=Spathaspora passalidarum (strain NRRL Y-27907 / 11-Y1) TaxID=619300 RepID=G3AEJ2_SPAPN|nr:ornithine decarboxylase [Spathaspora passalidarum NRRL Y-27907]EGW34754.1 ornithine decarboxylase [Spathaspora passalidarum NRRL Y-27907]
MTPSVIQDDQPRFESLTPKDSYLEKTRQLPYSIQQQANQQSSFASKLIGDALANHIAEIDHDQCDAGDEDSFFVCDLGEVLQSFRIWKEKLPQVHPHYAVKCNTNLEVIKLLAKLGVSFDCASKTEIDTIINLGIDSDRIVYANPCKTNSFIRHAKQTNVNLTTVDNVQELYKLQKHHPECGILIRIVTDDETAQCRLSTKFGCSLEVAITELLPLAKELGLNVKGVAFHVGSGAKDFDSIYKAIRDARALFDAAAEFGYSLDVLDIGGGFERETFDQSSKMVTLSLDKFFPEAFVKQHQVKFIAEPGRFMVANAFTLATHVIARRDIKDAEIRAMVYINDGVYGNMNCILFDHQHPQAHVLTHNNKFYYDSVQSCPYRFSIWGPTCDGLDCVSNQAKLSHDVQVGDWLYFPNLGAYTSAATTSFNGFKGNAHVIYVASEELP